MGESRRGSAPRVASLIAIAAGTLACHAHGTPAPGEKSDVELPALQASGSASSALSALAISTGALVPAFDPNISDYTVRSLTSLAPIQVTATTASALATVRIDDAPAVSAQPATVTLRPLENIVVAVHGPHDDRNYTVRYVPADLPPYHVWSDGRGGNEKVLLTPAGKYLLAVDRAGGPVYYRSFAPETVTDFQVHHLPSGATIYSALSGTTDTAWTLGVTHLFDASFHDIGAVQLAANRGHGVLPCEGHDFLVLGEEHYLAMSYVQRTIDLHALNPNWSERAPVLHAVVQEIDHGTPVFEWDSADYPSLYFDSMDGNAFTADKVSDYVHLNSMSVDPRDSNLVLSLRHTDSIVKVDRKTGQILWTMGGRSDVFGVQLEELFFHQHHVRVQDDGSLLVFDNGNGSHPTRVVAITLDEAQRRILGYHVIAERPSEQPDSAFMGSATHLGGGRYLIGWGGWSPSPDASPPSVIELVDGTVSWSLTFASPKVFSYRALPFD